MQYDLGYIDLEQKTLQPSTTRSARGCYPCLRYDLLPRSQGRTFDYLARPAGLEPTTPWFVARCSNPTELRARESELYQKLDDAYPRMGRLLAVHAISAHRWHALCAISDVRRRTPLPEAIRYWEMFDLRQLLPRVCRFGVKARRATRTEDEAVGGQIIANLQR